MNIVQAVSGYMTKMVSVGSDDGGSAGTTGTTGTAGAAKMKILLLDSETVGWLPGTFSKLPSPLLSSPLFS